MRDPVNPIADEIRRWAFTPDAEEPMQDWDLILGSSDQEVLFIELAANDDCPNADYFLSVLYLIVGDAARTSYRTRSKPFIEDLLKKAEARFPKRCINLWVQRSKSLMAHPETFRYDEWCAGILARRNEEPSHAPEPTAPSGRGSS